MNIGKTIFFAIFTLQRLRRHCSYEKSMDLESETLNWSLINNMILGNLPDPAEFQFKDNKT